MNDPLPPRDWLLARHASATPQLDRLRRAALPAPDLTWREFFSELVRPHRAAWRALAAAWLVIALASLTQLHPSRAPAGPQPSPEAVATWLRQLKTHETLAQIDRRP